MDVRGLKGLFREGARSSANSHGRERPRDGRAMEPMGRHQQPGNPEDLRAHTLPSYTHNGYVVCGPIPPFDPESGLPPVGEHEAGWESWT